MNKRIQDGLWCYCEFWKRALNFSGRANRAEFWYAFGVNFVIVMILDAVLVLAPDLGFLSIAFGVLTLIPSVSVWVRRLHDLQKNGLWVLLIFLPILGPVLLIYWACIEGVGIPNDYGPARRLPGE